MTDAERIRRAAEARTLLGNETLQAALIEIESQVLRQIALPPNRNTPENREWNYQLLQAGYAFRKALEKFVTDGNFSLEVLKQSQTDSDGGGRRKRA